MSPQVLVGALGAVEMACWANLGCAGPVIFALFKPVAFWQKKHICAGDGSTAQPSCCSLASWIHFTVGIRPVACSDLSVKNIHTFAHDHVRASAVTVKNIVFAPIS